MNRNIYTVVLSGLVVIAAGCGGRPQLAQVEGKVLINGEPVEGIEVKYIPDPEFGNEGKYSIGVTDENGRFQLEYQDDEKPQGASVGPCRVTMRDLLSAYTGRDSQPIPPRISQTLLNSGSTTLNREVEADVINNHVFNLTRADDSEE